MVRSITTLSSIWLCALLALGQNKSTLDLEYKALRATGPQPDSARIYIDNLCSGNDPVDNDLKIRCGYLNASLLSRNGELRAAWKMIREIDLIPTDDRDLKAQVKNYLGRIAFDNDEFDTAMEAFHHVLDLASPTDKTRIAVTYNNLGRVHERLKEYEKAFNYFEKSIQLYEEMKDEPRLAGSLLNLGVIYFDQKRFPEAEDRFTRSLEFSQRTGSSDVESIALESLGNLGRETGRYAEAMEHYNAAMAIAETSGSIEGIASISRNIGQLHLASNTPIKAIPYLQRTLALADSMQSRNYRQDAHYYLAQAYKTAQRPDQSLLHLEHYLATKDSILSEEKNNAIAHWQVKFDTAEKEREILEKEVQIAENRIALEHRQRDLYLAFGGLILLLLFLGFLVRDRIRGRKLTRARFLGIEKEQEIRSIRAMLAGEEHERERIAGELHDGIGVLLSAARMRVDAGTPESLGKASDLLAEVTDEVRRISHALMPGSLQKLGLAEALRDLVNKISRSAPFQIELNVDGDSAQLPENVKIGAYRIVQETLQNSVKHAHATVIKIGLIVRDHSVRLSITDNGNGFDTTKAETKGNGVSNVKARASMLSGKAILQSQPGGGTTWIVELPFSKQLVNA